MSDLEHIHTVVSVRLDLLPGPVRGGRLPGIGRSGGSAILIPTWGAERPLWVSHHGLDHHELEMDMD